MGRAAAFRIVFLAVIFLPAFSTLTPSPMTPAGLVGGGASSPIAATSITANLSAIADSAIASLDPNRNFGGALALRIGADPANASSWRSLVQFDLSGIPATSEILVAELRAYVSEATAPTDVQAIRLLAPWAEGTGSESAFERVVVVTETAGVGRVSEPVEARIVLGTPMAIDPRSDFRVYDAMGREIPSQVIRPSYVGGNLTAVTVVFGSSNRANEPLTYRVQYGIAGASVPSYRQKAPWQSMWTFPAGTTYASLAVADLDRDGQLETILGSTDGNVYAIWANGTRFWSANLGAPIESPVAVADLDGDGTLEVLAATSAPSNHRIYALTWDGQLFWNPAPNPGKAIQGPLIVADTDGNGIMEVYAGATDRTIYAFDGRAGVTLWTYALGPGQQAYGGALANFTGSPAPDLIFGTTTGVLQALTTGGSPLWSLQPGSNSLLQTPGVADINGDGKVDIVAGDRAASGNQFAIWGENGTTEWIQGTGTDQSGGNVLVDFGDDGQLETVFAKTTSGQIGVLDSRGRWLWNFTTGGAIYSVPVAADLNGDGEEDIAVGSFDNYVYLVASNGSLLQRILTDSPVRGTPAIADIDGDGTLDIIFASATQTQAYSTASLGHDTRVGSYNLRNTGHFLDGNSPDGAAFLRVSVGPERTFLGTGVTWLTRDGTVPWATPGSEYNTSVDATATATAGVWVTWNMTKLVRDWIANTFPNVGLVLRLANETRSARVAIDSRETGLGSELVVIYSNNLAPRITSRVPDQVFPEDSPPWSLNLAGYAIDPDSPLPNLRWDLAGANPVLYEYSGGNVTGNHVLTFQPKQDASGSNRVTLFLFDEAGHSDSQTLWVNLTPVNDPPYFLPGMPTAFYVHYDLEYTFQFTPYLADPDDSVNSLALATNDALHTAVNGQDVTFLYPLNYVDTWQFVGLTVSDGSAGASRTLAIRVTSDFPPERINGTELPDLTLWEGETKSNVFDLDDYFYDRDNDTLFYTFGFSHLNITIDPIDHTVDIQALGEWWGQENVTFRATDPTGALLEDTILVTVIPVNDPPKVGGVPPFVIHWDANYSFDLTPYIADSDTPIALIRVTTSDPTNVNVTGRILTMRYRNLNNLPYTVPLVINVTDGLNWTYATTTVTVTDDYPPVLQRTLPDAIFQEDRSLVGYFDLDEYFLDNDSATIFYTSGQVHVVVVIQASHSVDFSADANWYGIETVRFRATDDRGAIAEDTIKVIVQSVDDPPVIRSIEAQVKDHRSWFLDLVPYLDDVDTNVTALQVSATSAVGNDYVTVAGQNLLFNYPEGVTADTVTLRVSDGTYTVEATITVQFRGPDLVAILLPWIAAGLVAAASVLVWNRVRPQVEEVFLVHANGLPIAHLSRTLKAEKDTDIVTSMFTAIQNFTNDIFRARGAGDLNALQLGDYRLSVARGTSSFLVVLYHGRLSRGIERKGQEVVKEVEARFGTVLASWNGDVEKLEGVKEFMEQFFKAKASAVLERQPARRLGGLGGLGGREAQVAEATPEEVSILEPPLPPPPPLD